MSSLQGIATVCGRILLCTVFLMGALGNLVPNFAETAQYMTAEGIPFPRVLLAAAIALLILGSVSMVLGYQSRWAALLLLMFLVAATYYFHDYWALEDAQQRQTQLIHFLKNVSLMGAMILIVANGSGPISLDNFIARRRLEAI